MRGICPCTFRGRQIRETLIFSLERIFDKCNVFFFLSDPYWQGAKKIIFTACHSGKLKTKTRTGKCTGQKRIKSNKQFEIPGRKQ